MSFLEMLQNENIELSPDLSIPGGEIDWQVVLEDNKGKTDIISYPSYIILRKMIQTAGQGIKKREFTKEELRTIMGKYATHFDSFMLDLRPFLIESKGKYSLNTNYMSSMYLSEFFNNRERNIQASKCPYCGHSLTIRNIQQ